MSDKKEMLTVDKLEDILYSTDILPERAKYVSRVLSRLQPFLRIDRRKNGRRRRYESPGCTIPIKRKHGRMVPITSMYPLFDRRRNNYGVDKDEQY